MSFINWFSRKSSPPPPLNAQSSGLGHVDATVPLGPGGKPRVSAKQNSSAANRKHERLERRELLYAVVRDAMTRAGVLSASYKFKVLSLDSHGRQYLIMMDVASQVAGASARLAEIEALIAQNAKSLHEIRVTAVYWRVNEHVTAGLSQATLQSAAPQANPPPKVSTDRPAFEPISEDEVLAFKKSLAATPSPAPLAGSGEIVRSGRRNPNPLPQFADTELDERASPLSSTQYGDLI